MTGRDHIDAAMLGEVLGLSVSRAWPEPSACIR